MLMSPSDQIESLHPQLAAGQTAHDAFVIDWMNTPFRSPGQKWTLAIDLTATLPNSAGAESQGESLKKLLSESSGKPVTILVQVLHHNKENGLNSLERFRIEDGRIVQVNDVPSEGSARDLQNLLNESGHVSSDRIGLIVQSHGRAAYGLSTDQDDISIPELRQAVISGLSDSGHERLDFIDFDSCSMSSAHIFPQIAEISNTMISSAEPAYVIGNADAQNLTAIAQHIFANPDLSGPEVGSLIVKLAQSGANSSTSSDSFEGRSATPDIENFDLTRNNQFSRALNDFGGSLRAAYSDSLNREAINQLIENTRAFSDDGQRHGDLPGNEERDLLAFTEAVRDSLSRGQMQDRDGKLLSAAENLLITARALMPDHFSQSIGGEVAPRGISIFLPDLEIRNVERRVVHFTPLGILENQLEPRDKQSDARRWQPQKLVQYAIDQIEALLPESANELREIKADNVNLSNAIDKNEINQSILRIRQDIERLKLSSVGRRLIELESAKLQEDTNRIICEHEMPTGGWTDFINSVSPGASGCFR